MQAAADYLHRTSSAVQRLFAGIESYVALLRPTRATTFVSGELLASERDAKFRQWLDDNAEALEHAQKARRKFVAESFALSTLCGAVLQVAEKALELYSANTTLPTDLPTGISAALKPNRAKYCVGRRIREVPLGLIVYAGRNQHAHHEELPREPGLSVFEHLAAYPHSPDTSPHRDSAFNIHGGAHESYAGNLTSLIGWRSYKVYTKDMRSMLQLDPAPDLTPFMENS